jgi:Ankyrin repeat
MDQRSNSTTSHCVATENATTATTTIISLIDDNTTSTAQCNHTKAVQDTDEDDTTSLVVVAGTVTTTTTTTTSTSNLSIVVVSSISTTDSGSRTSTASTASMLLCDGMEQLQIHTPTNDSDDHIYEFNSCHASCTTQTSSNNNNNCNDAGNDSKSNESWLQQLDPTNERDNGNLFLHEAILDYPLNAISYPQHALEYEEQIRNHAQQQANPDHINQYNRNGYTPFHLACTTSGVSLRILQDLIHICPNAISTPVASKPTRRHRHHHPRSRSKSQSTTDTTRRRLLPLHLACRYNAGLEQIPIITFLLQIYPNAARLWTQEQQSTTTRPLEHNCSNIDEHINSNMNISHDKNEDGIMGDLPIHLYCQNSVCDLSIVQLLLMHYPASIQMYNQKGQLPIHIVCERQYFQRIWNPKYDSVDTYDQNSSKGSRYVNPTFDSDNRKTRHNSGSELIQYLLSIVPSTVQIRDQQRGELPLHTALRGHQSLSTLQLILGYYINDEARQFALLQVDDQGRTPLHRYCMMLSSSSSRSRGDGSSCDTNSATVEYQRLSLLLDHDTDHATGTMMDRKGYTPLHYVLLSLHVQDPDEINIVSIDILYRLIRNSPSSLHTLNDSLPMDRFRIFHP